MIDRDECDLRGEARHDERQEDSVGSRLLAMEWEPGALPEQPGVYAMECKCADGPRDEENA